MPYLLLIFLISSISIVNFQCQGQIQDEPNYIKNTEYKESSTKEPVYSFFLSQKSFTPKQIVTLIKIIPSIENKKDKELLTHSLGQIINNKNLKKILLELKNESKQNKKTITQFIASNLQDKEVILLFDLLKSEDLFINRVSMLTLSNIKPSLLYNNFLHLQNPINKDQKVKLYKVINNNPSPLFLKMAYNMYDPEEKIIASYGEWAFEKIKLDYPDLTKKYLLSRLNNNDETVYRKSIFLLRSFSNEEILDALILKMKSIENSKNKRLISMTITKMLNKNNLQVVLKHLRTGDTNIKVEMIWVLGQTKIKKTLAALVGQLENKSAIIRKKVVLALLNYDKRYIKDYFINQLKDPDLSVRNICILALAHYKINRIPEALIENATSQNSQTRDLSKKAILKIVNNENIKDLVHSKHQKQFSIQLLTLSALSKVKPQISYRYVQKVLNSNKDKPKIINLALRTLGDIKDFRSANTLLSYTSSRKTKIRAIAVKALGDLELESLFLSFVKLLNDGSPEVRKEALLALGKLGNKKAVNYILIYTNDKNPEVRKAAQKAIQMIKTFDLSQYQKKI